MGSPPAGLDYGGGLGGTISFTCTSLYGPNQVAGFGFPQYTDGGPANRYLAGTFVYIAVAGLAGNGNIATARATGNDTPGACSNTTVAAIQMQRAVPEDAEPASAVWGYPNPARDRFTLQLSGMKGAKGTIELLDINGRVLEQRGISFASNASVQTQVFSVPGQLPGVYFVRVKRSKGVQTLKVIVTR